MACIFCVHYTSSIEIRQLGFTSFFTERILAHFNGNGAVWTKIHKPLKIIETIDNVNSSLENIKVHEYISKFGIDKVRGGGYTKREYSNVIKLNINTRHNFVSSLYVVFLKKKRGI